jgi:hypothetical protein
MPRLFHLDRAVDPEAKIVSYLLNLRHSGGRAKARFLEGYGFRARDWRMLRDPLIARAAENEIAALHQSRFGTRYEIDGPLPTPDGRNPIIRVVWFVATGETPRPGDVGAEKDRCSMIVELDLVVVKRDLPTERLTAGDVGTVVLVHQQGAGYEIEFTTLSGDTVTVVTLDAADVRPVEPREIIHARAVS